MSNMNELLKKRIKEERLRLKWNQFELGTRIGKTNSAISAYEVGDKLPPVDILYKLADIFDCSVDYLLGRAESRTGVVHKQVVDGNDYELEIDKSETDQLTPVKFERLIRKLKSVGFDVDKLMDDIDLEND